MTRARATKLLLSAVALPLLAALLLPASFGVLVCRFGHMVSADDCCAGRVQQETGEDAPTRIDTEPCCSVRAVDLGAPLAEQSGRVEVARDWTLADGWSISIEDGSARPRSTIPRPAVRAIGPPLRLIKQSFLL